MQDVRRGTGGQIDLPDQVGGWPILVGGTPYPDADADGMDDDGRRPSGSIRPTHRIATIRRPERGYTNLDDFLSELAGDEP